MSITSVLSTVVQTETFPGYKTDYTFEFTYTNLGPLTTTFTPPDACTSRTAVNFWVLDKSSDLFSSVPCSIIGPGLYLEEIRCDPYGPKVSSLLVNQYDTTLSQLSNSWATFMSPGISCPSGYSTANKVTLKTPSLSSPGAISPKTLRIPGTHIFCCPRYVGSACSSLFHSSCTGLTLTSEYDYVQTQLACVSSVSTPTSTGLCNQFCTEQSCSSVESSSKLYSNHSTSCSVSTSCDIPQPFTWAPQDHAQVPIAFSSAVYMIHQKSDVPDDRRGLSKSSKIAIGVAVPIAVILAIIGISFAVMRKLRKKKASKASRGAYTGVWMQEMKTGSVQVHAEDPIALIPKRKPPKRGWNLV